jgi:hypothetical protein
MTPPPTARLDACKLERVDELVNALNCEAWHVAGIFAGHGPGPPAAGQAPPVKRFPQ